MSIGVMKDEKLKLRDLHASDTLGCGGLDTLGSNTMRVKNDFFFPSSHGSLFRAFGSGREGAMGEKQ
jgi:hypothetical protein